MKAAFVEALTRAAAEDPKVVFLTADLGFQIFDDYRARFGPRYINAGVAEAQMALAAAGLALEGWRPIIYSIASFVTARAWDQVRIAVNYHRLPVVVVGAGGGYGYAHSGVTHHSVEDFALLGSLPGMTVTAPGDPREVSALLPQLLRLDGPSYMRIGRGGEPTIACDEPILLGRARRLARGERVAVLTTADSASDVAAALGVLAAEGIHPEVWQFHTIKPLDTATLTDLASRVETFLVVEEHLPTGGLYSGILEWAASSRARVGIDRLGPPDSLALGSPHTGDLRNRLGYGPEGVASAVRSSWNDASRSRTSSGR